MGAKDCKYTLQGRRLTELRRAELRPIAKTLKVDADGLKNDILRRIVAKLDALQSEAEISLN
jgi:hypothetical protein